MRKAIFIQFNKAGKELYYFKKKILPTEVLFKSFLN